MIILTINPDRPLHVLLSGEVNEFAIPARCTKDEYEFVLREILDFNA